MNYDDSMFLRNISLSTAVFFTLWLVSFILGFQLAQNICLEEFPDDPECMIENVRLNMSNTAVMYVFSAISVLSGMFTLFIMIFMWKYKPSPLERIPNLEELS